MRTVVLAVMVTASAASAQLVRGPYLQLATPSSVTVLWRTTGVEESVVHYGASLGALTTTVTGAMGTDHLVTLNGLTAETRYFYSVGTTTTERAPTTSAEAPQYFFRTSPPAGAVRPFRFWVVGDDGTGDSVQAETVSTAEAFLAQPGQARPDLFVHVGDIAYNSGTEGEFTSNFFLPHAAVIRNTVVWPALGNHEGTLSSGSTQTGPYFSAYVLPTAGEAGGVPSGTEAYYSFEYANVHFVVLDSFDVSRSATGPMATWLRSDLMANTQEWIITSFHHPPYTRGTHSDTDVELREMRENILPILESAGVDLVLAGHSHIYERSYLLNGATQTPVVVAGHIVDSSSGKSDAGTPYRKQPGQVANDGTVYVVAGHGGASLGGTGGHPVMYFSEIAHGSCFVDVNGARLDFVNVRNGPDGGVVSDSFTLVKNRSADGGIIEVDAGVDAGADAGSDAGADAGVDAGTDAGADAGFDAGADAGSDAGVDAGFDAGSDAGADAGSDAGLDAGLDAGADAGSGGGSGGGAGGGAGGGSSGGSGGGSGGGNAGGSAGGSGGGKSSGGCSCDAVDVTPLALVGLFALRRRRRVTDQG